jgi:uncharacterized membrane protein YkvA (DUF1232 family)
MFQAITMGFTYGTVFLIAMTVIAWRWIGLRSSRVPAVTAFHQLPESRGSSMNMAWLRYLMVIGCVLYVLSPVDFLIDGIPGLGTADDVLLALATYRKWESMLRDELAAHQQRRQSDVIDVQYRASA